MTDPSEVADFSRYLVSTESVATDYFDWGQITWLDSAERTGSETLTVGRVFILPGEGNPEHLHPNCDEALLVVSGRLLHTLGDELFELSAGDLLHIPQGVRHRAENPGSEPAHLVVVYNTGRRQVEWV